MHATMTLTFAEFIYDFVRSLVPFASHMPLASIIIIIIIIIIIGGGIIK